MAHLLPPACAELAASAATSAKVPVSLNKLNPCWSHCRCTSGLVSSTDRALVKRQSPSTYPGGIGAPARRTSRHAGATRWTWKRYGTGC